MLRRNSSLSSISSSVASEEDGMEEGEWTDSDRVVLRQVSFPYLYPSLAFGAPCRVEKLTILPVSLPLPAPFHPISSLQAFEAYVAQLQVTQTPFQLNAPPFHIPHMVAKKIVGRSGLRPKSGNRSRSGSRGSVGSDMAEEQEVWKHGLRSTRAQLAHMSESNSLWVRLRRR